MAERLDSTIDELIGAPRHKKVVVDNDRKGRYHAASVPPVVSVKFPEFMNGDQKVIGADVRKHTSKPAHTHTRTRARHRACPHAHTDTRTHAYTHTRTHAQTHTRTRAHTHTRTHARANTRTRI